MRVITSKVIAVRLMVMVAIVECWWQEDNSGGGGGGGSREGRM